VISKAADGARHAIERAQVADRAEEAHDGVVPATEIEVAHVGQHEAARGTLAVCDLHERRVQVDAIHRQAVSFGEQSRVLARPARDIEHRVQPGPRPRQYIEEPVGLVFVVLEAGVDEIVELSGFAVHVADDSP
jgi:hypothetical protein